MQEDDEEIMSQSMQDHLARQEEAIVRAAIIGNRSYWVEDNAVWVAPYEDKKVIYSARQQVDAFQLDEDDMERLFLLLDDLNEA